MRKICWIALLIPVLAIGCAREDSASASGATAPATGVDAGAAAPAYQSGKMHVHDPNDPSHTPGKNYQGGSADSIEPGKQHIHDPADPSHTPGKQYEGGSAGSIEAGKQHIHDPADPSHSPGKNYQGGSADSIEPGKQHIHDPSDTSHTPGKNFTPVEVPDAAADAKAFYTCPMHPEVKKAAIGNCPKCGMRLVHKALP